MKGVSAYGNPDAATVLIRMVDEYDFERIRFEAAKIQKLTEVDFYLLAIKVQNWNHDLSPWRTPAVFGKEDFGNGAADTLDEVLKICSDQDKAYNKTCIIGGYSLVGLFALWAVYQTDVFQGVAAVSPSVWFPGFLDYMKVHSIQTNRVYLSLGDKEEKTRNPIMSTVGDRIREARELLNRQGINVILEWNRGNHFRNAEERTAKGFARLLNASPG